MLRRFRLPLRSLRDTTSRRPLGPYPCPYPPSYAPAQALWSSTQTPFSPPCRHLSSHASPPSPSSSIANDLHSLFTPSASSSSLNKKQISDYLQTHLPQMSPSDIAFLLTKSSKINLQLLPQTIQTIAKRLSDQAPTVNRTELTQILFSLKDYDNTTHEITQLRGSIVKIMRAKATAGSFSNKSYGGSDGVNGTDDVYATHGEGYGGGHPVGSQALDSRSLGMCFYGLKNMNYEMKHVPQMIDYLMNCLKETHEEFTIHTLSHSFRGLTGLRGDLPLTKELVAILHSKLLTCPADDILETKDVVNCYRSFQSLSIASDEVAALIRELIPHIDRFSRYVLSGSRYHESVRKPFSPRDLVNMYRAISKFDLKYAETRQLYHHLHKWLQVPLTPLAITDIVRIMFSLKDKKKAISPIRETFMLLSESLLSLTGWDNELSTARTPLRLEEITFTIQSLPYSHPLAKSSQSPLRSLSKLIAFSLQKVDFLTSNEIYRLFVGVASLSSSIPEDRELFLLLGQKLQHPALDLSPKTVCSIVNSLRHMDSNTEDVRKFLILLTEKLQNLPDLQIADKWACIYGLQSLSSNSATVRSFIKVLNSKFIPYPPDYRHTPQSVGCTLFGLQSLKPSYPEVQDLIQIILDDYQSLAIRLDDQAISNIFYGLQNLHDQSIPSSKLLLQLIIEMLKRNQNHTTLSAVGISQLAMGIKKYSSDTPEALQLLEIITHYFRQSSDVINSRILVNCLTGLKNFSSNIPQTEAFLSLLDQKILTMTREVPSETVNYSQLIQLFAALRNMTALTPSLRNLLQFLDKNVSRLSAHQMKSADFLACLFGLHQLSSPQPQPQPLLRSLLQNLLEHATDEILPFNAQDYSDYLLSLKNLSTEDPLTVDLMAYLIQRLPETTYRVSSTMVMKVVTGLKNKNLKLSETKVLLSHAIQLIENTNHKEQRIQETLNHSTSPPESPSPSSSSSSNSSGNAIGHYGEEHVLKICKGLSEFGEVTVEYQRLVGAITKTFLIISPPLSSSNKAEIRNCFLAQKDLGECAEVQELVRVIEDLRSPTTIE